MEIVRAKLGQRVIVYRRSLIFHFTVERDSADVVPRLDISFPLFDEEDGKPLSLDGLQGEDVEIGQALELEVESFDLVDRQPVNGVVEITVASIENDDVCVQLERLAGWGVEADRDEDLGAN